MKAIKKAAFVVAAERIAEEAESEEDPQLSAALAEVSEMLRYLGEGASSPLYKELNGIVSSSGGDGKKRELDLITASVAAFGMLCGLTQRKAADFAVELCGHSSAPTIRREFLKGACDALSVRRLPAWKEIEPRLESAETRVRYREFLDPETKGEDWDFRVVETLAVEARRLKSEVAQLSI